MNPPARHYKNRVLAALPKAEINRLKPHLFPVTLASTRGNSPRRKGPARLLLGRRHCVGCDDRCQRSHG